VITLEVCVCVCVCVCVLTLQRATIQNSWGIISQEISAVDCAKGKLFNCVFI